jgi:cob(I)alamin adenosyltransferase
MTDDHKAEMQALQAEQRRKAKAAEDPGRGLILVHTGDGKGKSSSAFGVIARALGWGQKVAVVQFIKGGWTTGERQFFDRFPTEVTWKTMGEGFTWDTQDQARDRAAAEAGLAVAAALLAAGEHELVVLDEVNVALRYDLLTVEAVLAALAARSIRTNVILTGRDAKPEVMAAADTVSEMREVKHAFQSGILAQRGIDY